LTATRTGASVAAVDLTPDLLLRARQHAATEGLEIDFHEGDVEKLPFENATFDVVVSQFGHIFAVQAQRALSEMLRVLKPGGTIAFTSWPRDLLIGRFFTLRATGMPEPPANMSSPLDWGDPKFVKEQFQAVAAAFPTKNLTFDRGTQYVPALGPKSYASFVLGIGATKQVVDSLKPEDAAVFRRDLETIFTDYFRDNYLIHDFNMARAIKQ